MKRLKIPTSSLKGTPLTIAEMKEITGGLMGYYEACSCILKYKNGSTEIVGRTIHKGAVCSLECSHLCSNTANCSDYGFLYSNGSSI